MNAFCFARDAGFTRLEAPGKARQLIQFNPIEVRCDQVNFSDCYFAVKEAR
jgi:hypothetical protein